MFDPVARESKLSQILPGLVILGVVSILLAILVQVNLLPGKILLVAFGPGFALAAFAVPAGVHSDSPAVFVLLGLIGTAMWWWLLGRGILWATAFWSRLRSNHRTPPT